MKKVLLIALVAGGFAFATAPSSNAGIAIGIGVGYPGYGYGYGYPYYGYGYPYPYYGYYRPYYYGGPSYYCTMGTASTIRATIDTIITGAGTKLRQAEDFRGWRAQYRGRLFF